MEPSRRVQVLALLDEALQTPPETRPALLDATCGGDGELRREVESLLALETAAHETQKRKSARDAPPRARNWPSC